MVIFHSYVKLPEGMYFITVENQWSKEPMALEPRTVAWRLGWSAGSRYRRRRRRWRDLGPFGESVEICGNRVHGFNCPTYAKIEMKQSGKYFRNKNRKSIIIYTNYQIWMYITRIYHTELCHISNIDMIWYDMTWHDMTWYDMIWHI